MNPMSLGLGLSLTGQMHHNRVRFAAPMNVGVEPTSGFGSATFTRASAQQILDHEPKYVTLDSGEAGIKFGRRVKNELLYSDDLTQTNWTKVGTATASFANGESTVTINDETGEVVRQVFGAGSILNKVATSRVKIKAESAGDVGETIKFQVKRRTGGTFIEATVTVTLTADYVLYSTETLTGTESAQVDFSFVFHTPSAGLVGFVVKNCQLEEVTGQANQNPGDYVATAGTAASQWFTYANGNTVSSNVVTEARGDELTGIKGYFSEGAGTNKCTNYNFNPTDTTNIGGALAGNTTTVDPTTEGVGLPSELDGIATTDIFKTTDPVGGQIVNAGGTTGNTNAHSMYVWVLCTSGSRIRMHNGAASDPTGYVEYSTWTKVLWENFTPADANRYFGAQVETAGDTFYWIGNQLEESAFATSPIVTAGASASRAACDLTYQDEGNFNDSEGYMYVELTPEYTSGAGDTIGIMGVGATARLLYTHTTLGDLAVFDGTNLVKSGVTLVKGTIYKVLVTWFDSTLRITVNGSTVAGTFSGTWSPVKIEVGTATSSKTPGSYKALKFGNRRMSQAEAEAITT